MLNSKQKQQLTGLGLLALALFLALALVPPRVLGDAAVRWFPSGNIVGPLGAIIDGYGSWLLGAGMVLVPPLFAVAGATFFGWIERGRGWRWLTLTAGMLLLVPILAALGGVSQPLATGAEAAAAVADYGGWLGRTVAEPLVALLGWFGALLALLFTGAALVLGTIGWRALWAGPRGAGRLLVRVRDSVDDVFARMRTGAGRPAADAVSAAADGGEAGKGGRAAGGDGGGMARHAGRSAAGGAGQATRRSRGRGRSKGKMRKRKRRQGVQPAAAETGGPPPLEDPGDPASAQRPGLELLSLPPERDDALAESELDRLGGVVVETLETFKVKGRIEGRTTGPVVTQFEFVPAPGIKVNKVAALDADLALALKAPSVRIVAPIPGKGAVGVEVPNPTPEVVHLREVLSAPQFQRSPGRLPLGLGKDLEGRPYVADLARMPHLLIAGATGSGKSVCINTLITGLIYRYPPRDMRMLLIDPKMVELSMYEHLPHLRHPVVTDPSDAASVLKWAVLEMEWRYELLSENGARSLAEFNRRAREDRPLRRPEPDGPEGDPDRWVYKDGSLPYVVIVVDELADLMMTVQAEIERPLAKLAQKARAIGIHLIVATQRPSVNVVTGLIKANFPSRIAFRVSSKVDSRTILDQNGADALLGNGDMLFLPPGEADPVRIQGAFVATADTEALMAWYREQPEGDEDASAARIEPDILDVVRAKEQEEAGDVVEQVLEDRDELFRQAAEVCVRNEQGSTSLLQRRLRIGYGRAARIVDQLQHAGVLGPPDGSKPREVLVGLDALDLICAGE